MPPGSHDPHAADAPHRSKPWRHHGICRQPASRCHSGTLGAAHTTPKPAVQHPAAQAYGSLHTVDGQTNAEQWPCQPEDRPVQKLRLSALRPAAMV
jgi:hypothetical protein